jgi:pyrroloquinoline quinone (PQQ) biosynthesis protein C
VAIRNALTVKHFFMNSADADALLALAKARGVSQQQLLEEAALSMVRQARAAGEIE